MPLSEEFQRFVNESDEPTLVALLRALQVRLGTPHEGPDDVDRATAIMHQVNNLRTLQTGSQTSTYNYDATNKLASISSAGTTLTNYLYDTRGNVTGKNATTLVFDQKNQLTQIAGSDTYAYDASGRRVSKTAGGVTTYYFYSQAGQLMYQWAPGRIPPSQTETKYAARPIRIDAARILTNAIAT